MQSLGNGSIRNESSSLVKAILTWIYKKSILHLN